MSTPPETTRSWRRPVSMLRRLLDNDRRQPEPVEIGHEFAHQIRQRYLGSLAPAIPEAARSLRDRVDELAKAGALDEGSGMVFDVMIGSWVQQWHNDIDTEHDARQSLLQLSEVEAVAELERRQRYAEWTRHELDEVTAQLSALTSRDGGND